MKNIFTVEALADWLETQDPTSTYDYLLNSGCLIARYFRAVGLQVDLVGPDSWRDTMGEEHPLSGDLNHVAASGLHTYDGALKRARSMSQPVDQI